jgi:urate oxidase
MTIVLGDNQYGKAETHVVRVKRAGPDGKSHEIKDLNVSVALVGDFAASHLEGDNSNILPTDTQKNTVFAFAKQPIGEIEDFALRLARHFVGEFAPISRARVSIEEQPWARIAVDGKAHPNAFVRAGSEKRTATVTCTDDAAWVVSGLSDLVVLKSAGSEFHGYIKDGFTTLPETRDRILATSVVARWRHSGTQVDWALPEVVEMKLSMPNLHHFVVDLSPFGLANDNEVFYASDRPYGLIEGTVARDDAPDAGHAW